MHDHDGKILNPQTGRYVLKTGTIGKQLMKSKCNIKNKILNPETLRCVNKDGKIGKNILKKSKSPVKNKKKSKSPVKKKGSPLPTKAPPNISKIMEKCKLNKVWQKKKRIGSGAVGAVYLTGNDTQYVLKIQKDDAEFRREAMILKKLIGWKHAPRVEAIWTCDNKGYIVLENLEDLNYPKAHSLKLLQDVLKKLHSKNITFPDCHEGNVMMRKDGTLVLIDFGWAEYFRTKKSKVYDNWLAQDVVKGGATMEDMYVWENYVLMDDFGTKEQRKEASLAMKNLKAKYKKSK